MYVSLPKDPHSTKVTSHIPLAYELRDNNYPFELPRTGTINISGNLLFGSPSHTFQSSYVYRNMSLGVGDFTIECWVNINATPPSGYSTPILQFGTGYDGSDGFAMELFWNGSEHLWARNSYGGIVGLAITGGSYLNRWHHVGIVRHLGAVMAFSDGNWSAPLSSVVDLSIAKDLRIGFETGSWMYPRPTQIRDARVTIGVCRYPVNSNFYSPFTTFRRPARHLIAN